MDTMRRLALVVIVALVSSGAVWVAGAAAESARTVQGEVVAVNVSDSPPIIVVKASTGKRELVVGAAVEAGAEIMRGKQRITLDSLKTGEKVTLVYVKKSDGLAARSIQAR